MSIYHEVKRLVCGLALDRRKTRVNNEASMILQMNVGPVHEVNVIGVVGLLIIIIPMLNIFYVCCVQKMRKSSLKIHCHSKKQGELCRKSIKRAQDVRFMLTTYRHN